jgi:hypothetical protein
MAPNNDKEKSSEEQITELRVIIDKLVTSLAIVQGNQGQWTAAANHLQSEKGLHDNHKD